jgi:elongation factor Ts
MKPIAVDKEDVAQNIIDKEIEIGMEQARQEGKPEQMLEQIAKGKLGKFFKESTLLGQAYVKDSSLTVRDYLKKVGDGVNVTGFRHVALG